MSTPCLTFIKIAGGTHLNYIHFIFFPWFFWQCYVCMKMSGSTLVAVDFIFTQNDALLILEAWAGTFLERDEAILQSMGRSSD